MDYNSHMFIAKKAILLRFLKKLKQKLEESMILKIKL